MFSPTRLGRREKFLTQTGRQRMNRGNTSRPQPRGLGDGQKGLPRARSRLLHSPLPRRPKSIILSLGILNAEIGHSPARQSSGELVTQRQHEGCGCEGRAAALGRMERVKAPRAGDFCWRPSLSGANVPFGNRDLQRVWPGQAPAMGRAGHRPRGCFSGKPQRVQGL